MSETSEHTKDKPANGASAGTTGNKPNLEHPQPAVHSDNEKSKLPERDDEGRDQSPADHPGKKSGEGEPSVS